MVLGQQQKAQVAEEKNSENFSYLKTISSPNKRNLHYITRNT